MAKSMTEDAVRDLAREALGLVDSEIARAGVGQLTTFNQLGFPGVADKPDGWYLPNNKNEVAVVLETKATRITLGQAQVKRKQRHPPSCRVLAIICLCIPWIVLIKSESMN